MTVAFNGVIIFHGFTISSVFKVLLPTTTEALQIIFVSVINNAEMDLFVDIFIFY